MTLRIDPTRYESTCTGSDGLSAWSSTPSANPAVSMMPDATWLPCRRTRPSRVMIATITAAATAAPSGMLTPSRAAATAPGKVAWVSAWAKNVRRRSSTSVPTRPLSAPITAAASRAFSK